MALDLEVIGNKLSRTRKQLILSVQEVSDETGLNVERLSLIEAGKIEPTGDEILILSDHYRIDYRFFISNQTKSGSEQVETLYRKFGNDFSKSDRRAVQDFIFLCECEQFLWNSLGEKHRKFTYKQTGEFYKGHSVEGALALRNFLDYRPETIPIDLYCDLRSTGLHIFRQRLSNSDISGLFLKHPEAGKCVLINFDDDPYRQNFTLAHEVGHSIFDYEQDVNVSRAGDNKQDLREVRANTFASNFLIPRPALRALNISRWTDEIILNVAGQLKVTAQALLIALKSDNFINNSEHLKFKGLKLSAHEKEDSELGFSSGRIKGSKQVLLEKGLSLSYIQLCHRAYSEHIISRNRMAEMLLSSEEELQDLLDLFSIKLTYAN